MPISGIDKRYQFPVIEKEKQNKSEVLDKRKNKVEISEIEVSRIEKWNSVTKIYFRILVKSKTTNHTDRWGDINYQQQKGEGWHHYQSYRY